MHFAFIFTIKGREGKRKRKKVMVIKGYIYLFRPLHGYLLIINSLNIYFHH